MNLFFALLSAAFVAAKGASAAEPTPALTTSVGGINNDGIYFDDG
jgi:hypothetical protein